MEESIWAWVGDTSASGSEKEAMQNAFDEINTTTDRAAAIVAAAFVEDHLAKALKARFHQDETLHRETFRSTGPLGSFSAKINFAFLIGLCSKEACKDLNTIKEIRNEFAHKVFTKDFGSQRVCDLANNLTFGERYSVSATPVDDPGPTIKLWPPYPANTPRRRYLFACQMFSLWFTYLHSRHPTPPTPPI